MKDAGDGVDREGFDFALNQSAPAVLDAQNVIFVSIYGATGDAPYDGIQAGTITTACQQTNAHDLPSRKNITLNLSK
jgi:hypothetical protein